MDKLGITVSVASVVAAVVLIVALIVAPQAAFVWFDSPTIKAYFAAAIILVCCGGGVSVYWLFHRPPVYRILLWILGFLFTALSASITGPFLANMVESASLSYVERACDDAGEVRINSQEWNAKLQRASYDAWDACVMISGMLFSGIFGIKVFECYFRVARYELKHGTLP